ncbi:MAG: transglutaminase-like domain-containing protein [Actinomycetaceae bacterium]|nr:transglutaminase-like domain-containing protein [Actinomycetaceae bacterium]MDO5747006.1 transglutaminase-like domain-containing protein [Actinomycetaceae bacterium]
MKTTHIPLLKVFFLCGLFMVAGLSHIEVFGGVSGFLVIWGAIAVGTLTAVTVAFFRLAPMTSLLVALLVFFLVGPIVTLPELCYVNTFPSVYALQTFVVYIVNSWRDLLTLQPPARHFTGPAVMPFICGYVCSLVSIRAVSLPKEQLPTHARRPFLDLILVLGPVYVLLVTGIMWGLNTTRFSVLIGSVVGSATLVWLVTSRLGSDDSPQHIMWSNKHAGVRLLWRAIGVGITIVIGVVVAVGVTTLFSVGSQRVVLRDYIVPPLDLHNYASPLADFRHFIKDKEKDVLFSVKGLPPAGRLRLAAMDVYDGEVYNIADLHQQQGGFQHIGTSVSSSNDPALMPAVLDIKVTDYHGPWVVGGGIVHTIIVKDKQNNEYGDTLFYSKDLQTIISQKPFHAGSEYRLSVDIARPWKQEQLVGQQFAQVDLPPNEGVPEEVTAIIPEILRQSSSPVEQIRAFERYFKNNGFFSNGKDGMSDAGHRAARIKRLLASDMMIGDDEQYAVAMTLMLREIGVPARVVMGFYPSEEYSRDAKKRWKVTGNDAHVWVEVCFQEAGWVAFDPTPPKDKTPQATQPQPKKTPRPLVLQPPQPPPTPAELTPDVVSEDSDNDSTVQWWLNAALFAVKIVSVLVLLLLPLIVIAAMKIWRIRRRKHADTHHQKMVGAWDEIIDRAWDSGIAVPHNATRWQQAHVMSGAIEGVNISEVPQRIPPPTKIPERGLYTLSAQIDALVYGKGVVHEESSSQAWEFVDAITNKMRSPLPAFRRIFARFWLTSLMKRARMKKTMRRRWLKLRWRYSHSGEQSSHRGVVKVTPLETRQEQ